MHRDLSLVFFKWHMSSIYTKRALLFASHGFQMLALVPSVRESTETSSWHLFIEIFQVLGCLNESYDDVGSVFRRTKGFLICHRYWWMGLSTGYFFFLVLKPLNIIFIVTLLD